MPRRSLENFLSLHQHLCKYLHKLHFDLFIFSGVLLNGTSNYNQIELSMEQESFQDFNFKSHLIYIPKCSSQYNSSKTVMLHNLCTKMSGIIQISSFFSSESTKISDKWSSTKMSEIFDVNIQNSQRKFRWNQRVRSKNAHLNFIFGIH